MQCRSGSRRRSEWKERAGLMSGGELVGGTPLGGERLALEGVCDEEQPSLEHQSMIRVRDLEDLDQERSQSRLHSAQWRMATRRRRCDDAIGDTLPATPRPSHITRGTLSDWG